MPEKIPRPGFSFPGPVPREALAYIENKGWKVGFSYEDVWKQEHAYAFTVAKAMQIDVLETIRAEVETALAEGRTLQRFKRDLTPSLKRLGWWGTKEMDDPLTGKTVAATLGSPRRLKVIYQTNLRIARAAGQWERAQRTKAALPYLLYTLGPSREHRPVHASWHGTLLPVDHPWWDSHLPIKEYGCKCRVRQVSEYEAAQLRERGVIAPDRRQLTDPETGNLTGHIEKRYAPVKTEPPQDHYREWVNKRTGEVEMVPMGVHPALNYNPGKERRRNLDDFMASKLEAAAPMMGQVAVRDMVSSRGFDAFFAQPTGRFPVAVLDDAYRASIGAKSRVVMLSEDSLKKNRGETDRSPGHPELTVDDYRQIPDVIERAQLIVLDKRKKAEEALAFMRVGEKVYYAVIRTTRTGKTNYLTSFRLARKSDIETARKLGQVLRDEL